MAKYSDNLIDYLDFNPLKDSYQEEIIIDNELTSRSYIKVHLESESGFICRTYFEGDQDVDYSSIKENGKYVIPGSSIAGVLASECYKTLKALKVVSNQEEFKKIFVEKSLYESEGKFGASRIIVNDGVLNNTEDVIYTRSAVDRFSGAAKDGALFVEQYVSKGDFELKVEFDVDTPEYIIALYYLAIQKVASGQATIGGQESIGRGHFRNVNDIEVSNELADHQFLTKLKEFVKSYKEVSVQNAN